MTHINIPKYTEKEIQKIKCPDCKKESIHILLCADWYGWGRTCLRCGRHWEDGDWQRLPFCKGARKQNIDSAKKGYRQTK